jgi:hypothetical protein
VIAASDDTLVVAVNEQAWQGKRRRGGENHLRSLDDAAGRAIRIIFFETRDEALEAAGLSE